VTRLARLLLPMVALVLQAVSGQAQAAGPEMREGYLDAGGVRLFYRAAGTKPDTLVVLHRGPGFTLGYLAEDLEAVRRHFRLERVAVLGHSWGARVAALCARRYRSHPRRRTLSLPRSARTILHRRPRISRGQVAGGQPP